MLVTLNHIFIYMYRVVAWSHITVTIIVKLKYDRYLRAFEEIRVCHTYNPI